jgi:predicted GIY-YIG superfamily endonuclease
MFVYLLRCSDNSLYCGITNNLVKRLEEHNSGKSKAAKYTKPRLPVRLVYSEKQPTKNAALKRELQIKNLTKPEKEKLVNFAILKNLCKNILPFS